MKTIQVLRPTTVSIYEVEEMDLRLLSHKDLLDVSLQLLNALTHTNAHPEPVKPLKSHPHVGYDHKLGIKKGRTSKYHYVDFSQGKFRGTITINKKAHYLGRFVNERDAALAVDTFLNSINDTKRPRNKDAFPELLTHRGIAR